MKANSSFCPVAIAVAVAVMSLALQACSSGSGGSGVGNQSSIPPTARAQVLNGGANNRFREGSEVLLTGKDSEDADGPVLFWSWRQTAGPTVRLIERNTTTVSFAAPDVSADTTLTFELTVEDSSQLTASSSVDVSVAPARDADKFLSLDVRGTTRNTYDTFEVVAALAEGASTNSAPKPFILSVRSLLVYPPRSAANAECRVDLGEFAAGIPTTTATGCRVELLEDLTPTSLPGGGTGIQGQWPADVPPVQRPGGLTAEQLRMEWWNPTYTLRIPRLDVAEFNQQFVDAGQRTRLLDLFNAHKAQIVLAFQLVAPENQADATLILNGLEGVPVGLAATAQKRGSTHAKVVANQGAGLPTSAIVPLKEILAAIPSRESELTAEVYYRTVDPLGTRATLNAWLHQAGFAADRTGALLAEARNGEGAFAHAIYLNNYDLGFGRDMYARQDELGNVYSFVVNYATLEGAIRKSSPIVTVVMEYSPLLGPEDAGSDRFVKFFTYIDDGGGDSRLVTSMDFDGRGERVTPGNCVACHGGVKPPGVAELRFDTICGDRLDSVCYSWPDAVMRDGASIDVANGNLHATFLPWDLDSLLFADTDPAITDAPRKLDGLSLAQRLVRDYGDYSRTTALGQIKKLNQMAHSTYCDAAVEPGCVTDAARRLVEHWYGGVDQQGRLAGSFSDSTPVPGWRNNEQVADPNDASGTATNPDDAAVLYRDAYAPHCRMCHTNLFDPALQFDTYQKLMALAPQARNLVYQQGVMPAARLTMDRLWVPQDDRPVGAEVLASHLGIAASPPAALAEIAVAPSPVVPRHAPVRFTAHGSLFARTFAWTVSYDPPPELAGSSAVLGYQPNVIGDGTPEIAFVPERPGAYTARLVINGADPAAVAPELEDTQTVAVENRRPLACDDSAATVPNGPPVHVSFLQNDRFGPAGSDCASTGLLSIGNARDLPLTYVFSGSFGQNGQLSTANGGTFTLDVGEPCTLATPSGCADDALTYTPGTAATSYVDSLTYTITDADGEVSNTGTVAVAVTADLEVNVQAVADPVSEALIDLSVSISGGALAEAGERYTVTLSAGPSHGTVARGGVAMTSGSVLQTDGAPEDTTFSYVSDPFASGAESIIFTVTDSDATARTAQFSFQVLPQAPFSTPATTPGQLGTVMEQWASTADGKDNCARCHSASGANADPSAIGVFDLSSSQSVSAVHGQLVTDTIGNPRKVDLLAPERSLILCYPSADDDNCDRTNHGGGLTLPEDSHAYDVLLRWIQEGALEN